jgi:four helix bundle protein
MQGNFKDLKLWKEAMNLAAIIYELTGKLSTNEKFGLISQMRRAAVSIPSNIAEGSGRGTIPQLIHFLNIAQGSAFELETQLLLLEKMNLVSSEDIETPMDLLLYVQKMNFKLKQSLTKK